ncbi:hypothetical protein SELMODRAFT_109740 [Selaginella moellendorffii]|uniref:SNF2 family DNA-dependent ATPase n=1 Tax=Selaginella moellendorffii TaxID=88036 RepID=D8S6M5_SELML|nr:helicase-like transcription factor CHR27 [Selaginella moellendorffii]EFJ19828.1 hypothetical protein SELMODRAFT_109740 [Selaginella moellendorffii]|eukprot:XP_002978871.1 helicase-like transcription factor CHR27 [Selaginella moellendorffii]
MKKRKGEFVGEGEKKQIQGESSQNDLEPRSMTVELMNHQKQALAWMLEQESSDRKGGILADDQGLGKTLSAIALILEASPRSMAQDHASQKKVRGGTLIVCPVSVIRQWESEIATKVAATAPLSTFVYHDKRKVTPETLALYDVVITTYGVLAKEQCNKVNKVFNRRRAAWIVERQYLSGPLGNVAWHRVVLDEAQSIRNAYTQVSRSCMHLSATYRWALSGTPFQNNIKDLYAFFCFLRVQPYCHNRKAFDEQYEVYEKKGYSLELKAALESIVLRRNKNSIVDGEPVLRLPPRLVNRVEVELSKLERELYEDLMEEYEARISEYSSEGTLQMNKFNMLSMLLRLRQMCNHPALLDSDHLFQVEDDDLIMDEDGSEDGSGHQQMREALSKLQLEAQERQEEFDRKVQEIGQSAKLKAAMRVLDMTPHGEKSLIFSQWTSMLDLIEPELEEAGIQFSRIDGSMSTRKRVEAIKRFSEDPEVAVMLISLRAGGCGLNLVAATRVLLMDMWWNPTTEDQAIDRTHRIGQTRPVHVTRFVVKQTVEERILQIQEEKKKLVEFAFGEKSCKDHSLSIDELTSIFVLQNLES